MERKTSLIYILSFLSPIIILLFCIFSLNIFPFGDKSFLYWDSQLQYVNFYSYLKSTFFTNNNLFYSFSHLGGNNMLDMSACYNYFSPFNIIFFLFPDEYLNIALEFLMIIKIGLCGLTMSYFLNKEIKQSYLSVLISTSYALSMHTLITTMSNFIFMDGIILLPLVILGVSKIVEKNDCKLYFITLFLSILTQAYMGYVAILLSFIYLIYKIALKNEAWDNLKSYFVNFKAYLFSTAISVGLCAWFIIPVMNSMQGGKYGYFNILNALFNIRANLFYVISKFYTANLIVEFWQEEAPYIFVGILALILLILYFFNKGYTKKERTIDGIVVLFLFSTFFINFLFTLFNMGVEYPSGTIFRFGHIFVFFILILAYKELIKINETKIKNLLATFFIYLFMGFSAFIADFIRNYKEINGINLFLDMFYGTFILFLIFLYSYKKEVLKNVSIISIIILHLINLSIHTNFVFESQRQCCVTSSINSFKHHIKSMKNALSAIYGIDKGFYRITSQDTFIEREDRKIYNNGPFLNSYDSITGYSSLGNSSIRSFYYNIGVPIFLENMLFTYSDNIQTLPVSLLSVKYIISSNPNVHTPYEKIKTTNENLNIYKNPYSFPFAFLIEKNDKLFENVYEKYQTIPDFQNNIVKILLNDDLGNIYHYKKGGSILNKLNEIFKHSGYIVNHVDIEEKLNFQNNTYFLASSTGDVGFFIYQITFKDKGIEYYTNDLNSHIIYLGNKANNINIGYTLQEFSLTKYQHLLNHIKYIDLFFMEENLDVLKKYYEKVIKNKCEIEKISSSHLKGKLNIQDDNKLLFMTIPYDESWNIKINGKKRKAVKLFDAVMAIPVFTGDSEIEMKFIPKGFYLGLFISLISLVLLLVNVFTYKQFKKRLF